MGAKSKFISHINNMFETYLLEKCIKYHIYLKKYLLLGNMYIDNKKNINYTHFLIKLSRFLE